MTELELAMMKESLTLVTQALTKLSTVNNASLAHISNILLDIVTFGNEHDANSEIRG